MPLERLPDTPSRFQPVEKWPLLLRSLRTARQNKDEPFVNVLLILLEHLDTIMATCPELDLNA